jgi:uncharacterized protein
MLLSAFILGLAGSLHCVGMCSPLAFAVTNMKKSVWLSRALYNAGRIFTYGILGATVSSIGVALPLENFQTVLTVAMGLILISIGAFGSGRIKVPYIGKLVSTFTIYIKSRFSFFLQQKSSVSIFFLGILNGLLPCGLTLAALTSCLILPNISDGFYFMIAFGAGTLPVMLGFVSLVQYFSSSVKLSFQRVTTIMLLLAGSLLIGRAFVAHQQSRSADVQVSGIEVCP